MDVNKFIEYHYKHFNAGALAECSKSLQEFLENDGRMLITLAGAMSTAEIGRSLAPAIRSQKIMQFVVPVRILKKICSI